MKKVLLLSLGLVMGFSAFAQVRVAKENNTRKATVVEVAAGNDVYTGSIMDNSAKAGQSVVVNRATNFEEAHVMSTFYDLQSNSHVSNRMYQNANGDVAVATTMSLEANMVASDRGTGYSFSAGGDITNFTFPEAREEANATGDDLRTGWPTIAPYGANGEILVNHTDGLNYWIRETAGEGQWDGPYSIPNPTGLEYPFSMSWPRVTTSGPNNDIIHVVAAAQHQVSSEEMVNAQFYCRSTDGQNWEVAYAPLAETDEHIGIYSADDYSIASNGDVVAICYNAVFQGDVVVLKSTDNGQTWERLLVWENKYDGDWETDESTITPEEATPTPVHSTVAVGPDGTVHVAFSIAYYHHTDLSSTFSYYYGRQCDGIAYWNDTREPLTYEQLDLWVPDLEQDPTGEYVFHTMDSLHFCGWMPFYENVGEMVSEQLYGGDDYVYAFYGAVSGYPALSVDSEGNLALAYSTIDTERLITGSDGAQYYAHSAAMSYKDADSEYWTVAVETVMDDFMHMLDEVMYVNGAAYVTTPNEFWFTYVADQMPGLAWGSGATQTSPEENMCYVYKISSEYIITDVNEVIAKDVVYNVFPNPASDMIYVSSSMNAEATVTFTNLAGQTVKVVNTNLTTGNNSISINDLNSGIYFCTVNANGYSHTSKVVVK